MLNKVILQGRLCDKPEHRQTNGQEPVSVTNIRLAVKRDYGKNGEVETDFINCVAWRSTAEFIDKYFDKGSLIVLEGHLQSKSWEDEAGNKRYGVEVSIENAYFGDSKKDDAGTPGGQGFSEAPQGYPPNAGYTGYPAQGIPAGAVPNQQQSPFPYTGMDIPQGFRP